MKRFHYQLDAIIKQADWEIDALKLELMTLNQTLNARNAELRQLNGVILDAKRQIMETCKENTFIALDRKRLLELYLRDRRVQQQEKEKEVEHTKKLTDGVFLQLCKKKQFQRSVEKHRERKKKDFESEVFRKELLEADELWLAKLVSQQRVN